MNPYPTTFHVIYAPTIKAGAQHIEKLTGNSTISHEDSNVMAFTSEQFFTPNAGKFKGKSRHHVFVVFDPLSATPGIIAHECLHAMNFMFKYAGVKPDLDNDEPAAYLLDTIVSTVHTFIKNKKR